MFGRYHACFAEGLQNEADLPKLAGFFSEGFVAAHPGGVMIGNNDDTLLTVMAQGFERYRASGCQDMALQDVRVTPIDALHCVATVAWTATYQRADLPRIAVDFTVHYLIQVRDQTPKIFGWIADDEETRLRARGIL